MTDRFLKLPDVIKRSGLSRSSIYEQIKQGQFPKQRQLSIRAVAWLESEITAWIETKVSSK